MKLLTEKINLLRKLIYLDIFITCSALHKNKYSYLVLFMLCVVGGNDLEQYISDGDFLFLVAQQGIEYTLRPSEISEDLLAIQKLSSALNAHTNSSSCASAIMSDQHQHQHQPKCVNSLTLQKDNYA